MQKKVLRGLFKLLVTYPRGFIKQININNLNTLKTALLNESPGQILSNATKLLQKSQNSNYSKYKPSLGKFEKSLASSSNKRKVIIVSHEASRTGAPLIALNIGKHFKEHFNIQPIFILCLGGELTEEFESVGPTYLLKFFHNNSILSREVRDFVKIEILSQIQSIYFNSEASTKLLKHFKVSMPRPNRVSLVHELGRYYPKNAWRHIAKYSSHVIYPSEFVKNSAFENTPALTNISFQVLGQGLMNTALLGQDHQKHQQELRTRLNIPVNSKIVFGCGSPIPRKGTDLFINSAIITLNTLTEKNQPHELPYFIWLGSHNYGEFQVWLQRDIEDSGWANHIKLIPSVSDPTLYFLGSDIFFLSSRGDPFPCVVHEALAAQLPIIAFENTNGHNDFIRTGFGKVVPYGNVYAVSLEIQKYLANPQDLNDIDFDRLKEYFSFVSYSKSLSTLSKFS